MLIQADEPGICAHHARARRPFSPPIANRTSAASQPQASRAGGRAAPIKERQPQVSSHLLRAHRPGWLAVQLAFAAATTDRRELQAGAAPAAQPEPGRLGTSGPGARSRAIIISRPRPSAPSESPPCAPSSGGSAAVGRPLACLLGAAAAATSASAWPPARPPASGATLARAADTRHSSDSYATRTPPTHLGHAHLRRRLTAKRL